MTEPLAREIAAYERERARLEKDHAGGVALVHGDSPVEVFPTLHAAAEEGLRRFGAAPFLVRRIGDGPLRLSLAMLYGVGRVGDPIQLSIG